MEFWMNRPKYGMVVTENLKATQFGNHIFSLVDETKDVENGFFGYVGNKLDGERELSEFLTPDTTNMAANKAVLVANPVELFAAVTPEGYQPYHFINFAGKPMRCYELSEMDEFGITEYTIDTLTPYDSATGTGGATVGNFIVLQTGSNRAMEVSASGLTGMEVFVGEIIDIDNSPLRPYFMILGKRPARMVGVRVVKNSV